MNFKGSRATVEMLTSHKTSNISSNTGRAPCPNSLPPETAPGTSCAAGLRPSEVVNLSPQMIRLDAQVPHLKIMPEGRGPIRSALPFKVGEAVGHAEKLAASACEETWPTKERRGWVVKNSDGESTRWALA